MPNETSNNPIITVCFDLKNEMELFIP